MERQRIIIPTPDGELVTSLAPTLINDGDTAKFENAERVLGKTRKRPGTSGLVTEIANSVEPRGIYNFKKADGTEHILVYERGLTTSLTKKIYTAVAGTWSWDFINKDWATQGEDLVLTSSTVPRFETFRDYCFISQGDTVIGLMYWSGDGNIKRVIDEGDAEYGVSGRFINIWKERLVVSNGYYYALTGDNGSAWSTSRISSGVFFSSLTYSDGTIVHPYQSKGWWEVVDTFKEIAPNDGSEIVAQWMGKNRMFFGKETGIWAMFGDDPAHIVIDPITDIGMETDHSLREYMNGWIFKGKYGWRFFDGVNQPQLIDKAIRNLTIQVPNFDIGGELGGLDFDIDSETQWTNAMDASTNITVDSGGYIEISKETESLGWEYTTSTNTTNPCDGFTGIAFRMDFQEAPTPPYFLHSINLYLKRGSNKTGNVVFSVVEGNVNRPTGGEVLDSVTEEFNDLPTDYEWYEVDFGADVALEGGQGGAGGHYWIVVGWDSNITHIHFKIDDTVVSGYNYTCRKNEEYQWLTWGGRKGNYKFYITHYETYGIYHTKDDHCNFGVVPDTWGDFSPIDSGETQHITYYLRTSEDGSTYPDDWKEITPGHIDENEFTPRQYVDYYIQLGRTGYVKTPKIYRLYINAFVESGEITDRLMCSTIFNNKYLCPTNRNLDGEFRTFVLDEEKKWGIYPDQLIRGYVDIDKEKYLMTLNEHMELYKMYSGKIAEEYFYDWSVYKNTSSKFYYFDVETKKTDCGYPRTLKFFHELELTVGSIMGTKYVQGIIRYRIDDGDWVTRNFQDTADSGDVTVARLIFPAETSGYMIQFAYETYRDTSTIPPTDYGQPYNLQSAVLTFYTQPELKSTVETQTADLDVRHMIEE